jgi:hypothetical protein
MHANDAICCARQSVTSFDAIPVLPSFVGRPRWSCRDADAASSPSTFESSLVASAAAGGAFATLDGAGADHGADGGADCP